jgi:uncharacterized protein (TIGR02147 family)
MEKNLFILNSYNSIILLKMGHFMDKWGLISKMAEAAQCQRSHLSRVIKAKAQLTLEQAAGLSEFFKLNDVESEYFLALVELERAGTPVLKARFKKRITQIRQDQENIGKRLRVSSLNVAEQEMTYYSAWYWLAIHIAVSIPELQTPAKISKRLNLEEDFVRECLEKLESFNLVKRIGERWVFSSQSIHLPKTSPLIGIHHGNWKSRAVLSSQTAANDHLHYTVVQSLSREDFQKVKAVLLETIDHFSKIALPSKEEELVCFSCDFFRV